MRFEIFSTSNKIYSLVFLSATERHKNLTALSKEVNNLKNIIEQEKISKGENVNEIAIWGEGIEAQLETVDGHVNKLIQCVQHPELSSKAEAKAKEIELERERQLEIEQARLELKFEYEKKAESSNQEKSVSETQAKTSLSGKLQKLSI